jgi:hypothetical protein
MSEMIETRVDGFDVTFDSGGMFVWDGGDEVFNLYLGGAAELPDDKTIALLIRAYRLGCERGERAGRMDAQADMRIALGIRDAINYAVGEHERQRHPREDR